MNQGRENESSGSAGSKEAFLGYCNGFPNYEIGRSTTMESTIGQFDGGTYRKKRSAVNLGSGRWLRSAISHGISELQPGVSKESWSAVGAELVVD
jgi:hypothetical protein